MSSGSQIGGAVGAVVGGVIGFYTGNPAQGAQWGYAIGSAVGGYVDPTRTYGPRLEDANAQTSTVGGVIPFGYGTFTCMGNIIWCDDLIEHVKTERVGKGGGEKQTTYTYTRSYAIGVCEGPISRYMWIKKNGKLVYAADPAALGAAMGWAGEQIADLSASSAEFRQMTTLYFGTSTQMPDPVIEAVEGVGNVAPHRDLAYIVMENEDLTDMQGAVSQYEFCVFVGAAKSYTTPPYPVYVEDSLSAHGSAVGGGYFGVIRESIGAAASPVGGSLREVIQRYSTEPESMAAWAAPIGGSIRTILQDYEIPAESVTVYAEPVGGSLKVTLIRYSNYKPEGVAANAQVIGGMLE